MTKHNSIFRKYKVKMHQMIKFDAKVSNRDVLHDVHMCMGFKI